MKPLVLQPLGLHGAADVDAVLSGEDEAHPDDIGQFDLDLLPLLLRVETAIHTVTVPTCQTAMLTDAAIRTVSDGWRGSRPRQCGLPRQ